ncbi:PepSY domain-containing protein [Neisseria dentiae]|uniref:PepSY domain-containing protein n=1 Tax=Neisseria dentiae TaxID=194197 RepID=UPI00359FDE18
MTTRNKTLSAVLAAVIAATSLGAYAATGGGKSTKAAAFEQAAVSAGQAVQAASQKVQGRATAVDFKHKNGQSHYQVEIVSGNQKHEVRVDANSGQVLDSKAEQNRKQETIPNAAISIEQAIAAAQSKNGGKAKDAELDNENGQAVYKVETVSGTQKHDVVVNAGNGQVISAQPDQED